MTSTVLWRRLSETDFRAINGNASPFGRGGGAMHIALGVRTEQFPIDNFLSTAGQTEAIISAAADRDRTQVAQLAFSGNPKRRGGEWRIRDQHSHRHPAWATTAGFPTTYNAKNPPYILIFKTGKSFQARYSLESELQKLSASRRPKGILSIPTGISAAPPEFVAAFLVLSLSRLEEFQIQEQVETAEAFDPKSISDGRKRILGAVIRRLGQQAFRRKLISAYAAQCTLTQCRTLWVLEAAHISPYRGVRTNAVSNGLLLRADVHTLFDLALIAIEPSKLVVRVSKLLAGSQYEPLDGREPTLPAKTALHPSPAALEYHYRLFHP
jgi:hypothetical protein